MNDPDELESLLKPSGAPPTPGLRDRLRLETTRQLRRRRHLRRALAAATLAACYIGGALTMRLAWPGPDQQVVIVERPAQPASPPRIEPPRSPHALELAAEQADGAESARLFLEAGRRYGSEFNDWPSALRCYRNALDLSNEQTAIDPSTDDWLLVKLKTERRETHAIP